MLPTPRQQADTYTKEEVERLRKLSLERGKQLLHDMIVVFSQTGMRFAELQHLVPESIDWDATTPYITIKARKDFTPKDPEEVKTIPMSKDVQGGVKRLQRSSEGGYLFFNSRGNKVHESHPRERLQTLFKDAINVNGRRLHFHSFRNYFVKSAILDGMPVSVVMKITGHDTAQMCLHYPKIENEEVSIEAEKLFEKWGNDGEV